MDLERSNTNSGYTEQVESQKSNSDTRSNMSIGKDMTYKLESSKW